MMMKETKAIIKKWFFCYAVFLLIGGCTSEKEIEIPEHIERLDNLTVYPADVSPESEIELIREQAFGSTDEVLIGRLGSIGVDTSGRVFLEDTDNVKIHVLAPDGSHITHFGREGRGPGEFRTIHIMGVGSDQLYVYDPLFRRLSLFSLDSLSFTRVQNMTPKNKSRREEIADYRIGQLMQMDNNTYLAGFAPMIRRDPGSKSFNADSLYRLYYKLDSKGRFISDKILEQRYQKYLFARVEGEHRSTPFGFMGSPLLAVSNDEHIFSAWSVDFLIKVRDSTGTYQRAFYYPVSKRKFSREEALKKYDSDYHQSVIKNAPSEDFPEFWPVLNSMLPDDKDRLWVSTVVDDQEIYQWWVLDVDDGSLLTRFNWPREKQIETIKNGKLYARETEEETGLEKIVRYDIEFLGE